MKGKAGHVFQRLKADKCYPDLMVRPKGFNLVSEVLNVLV
jgi:hypothetical protein